AGSAAGGTRGGGGENKTGGGAERRGAGGGGAGGTPPPPQPRGRPSDGSGATRSGSPGAAEDPVRSGRSRTGGPGESSGVQPSAVSGSRIGEGWVIMARFVQTSIGDLDPRRSGRSADLYNSRETTCDSSDWGSNDRAGGAGMGSRSDRTADEDAIRELVERWARAVRAKD